MVVETELQPRLPGRARRRVDSPHDGLGLVERVGIDPADCQAVGSEHRELGRERLQLVLDRLEPCVAADRDETGLVEPRAHRAGLVTVQVVELHTVVALRAEAAQSPFEVAIALGADRVELQGDVSHTRPYSATPPATLPAVPYYICPHCKERSLDIDAREASRRRHRRAGTAASAFSSSSSTTTTRRPTRVCSSPTRSGACSRSVAGCSS